ncbi:MAG: SLBB domain-containing protein [Ignavibacteriaceae bacterium]|nr:SLBB domain-containing protein [Ignavibacteriaceae bacterium]
MKKLLLLISIFTLTNLITYGQVFPSYKERTITNLSDSIYNFNNSLTATEGNIDPEEYIVGPGDKLFISIGGIEEIALNVTINQEGFLYIPKVGGIDLRKTSLKFGKEKIIRAINRYYKNVEIFISLVDFRKIKVNLLGDVKKPASYILPGNARLMDLVANSSGLNPTSNYRNIKIISKDNETSTYDLIKFLRFGDRKSNPMLNEGDIIIIDKVDRLVFISGLVKYPGSYEFKENETVGELIELAGGLLNLARKDTIEIISFDSNGKNQVSRYYSYDELNQGNLILAKQDQVVVREIPEYYVDRYVSINGYVMYPGFYKIIEDQTTLLDIIKEAGGFKKEASLTEAWLTRTMGTVETDPEYERLKMIPRVDMSDDEYDYLKAKSRQRKGRVTVDFYKLFKLHDISENVVLKRGDVISVPEAKNYIIMLGQVVNAGNLIYEQGLNYLDYINLAGGFGWRAKKGDVRIIRSNTGEWVDAEISDSLKPGDAIWIPEKPQPPKFWDVFTTSLTIVGQLAAVVAASVAIIIATRK